MSKTPEGTVKAAIKDLLAYHDLVQAKDAGAVPPQAVGWYYMPVQHFSVKGIPDFLGHYRGVFFAVEAKAPGKAPTGFQQLQIDAIDQTGGTVFVIDGDLGPLERWLERQRVDYIIRRK